MCFGSKDERDDEPAPRPAQRPVSPPQSHPMGDVKNSSYMPQNTPGRSSGEPSYAPPGGPPPDRNTAQYAPPPGPPPGQSSQQQFAPPSGPPPGQSQHEYAPPSGPPPGQSSQQYDAPPGPPPGQSPQHEYAPPSGPPPGQSSQQQFAPPPGPPPGRSSQQEYAPPSGPPPGQSSQQHYAPPPGPPPGSNDWIQPPSGPPPSAAKQPQHDWEVAVPDTSLFPPPPAIFSGYDRSPTSNATEDDAIAGEDWCERYPLTRPIVLDQLASTALEAGNIRLMEPAGFSGKLTWLKPGQWDGYTAKNSPDRCIIGYPPLYSVTQHDPLRSGRPKTIYYEVKLRDNSPTVFLGLGFTALPYPSFRMPGWHRGSLAVHGDDGHKYINDRWGGKDFTDEFRRGDTYGIGMTFRAVGQAKPQVDIFFTRNGTMTGGWALHEETDAEQDLPVTGMEGLHDLSCAIGTYDAVAFEVIFDAAKWLYNPNQV
ncbi:hypothetical protein BGZ61DRAFT_473478 [Ilyonectria robusta]|uniref:uncharacterized protein n=1 Tax=Ilyonectria robusta TaxID=1079257 RepID=UPI001E8D74B6|nr:uncharacterized protein BGZ61DRAFT_473478 [Ilyonectria robusta]KAH8734787.1 hypothetical protein BGZ61DRAFT_473478 [Ilyonectria robusta]